MQCREADRLIDAYLGRELSDDSAGELVSHLAACAKCRREYELVGRLLCPPGREAVPDGLRDRIVDAVTNTEVKSRPRRTFKLFSRRVAVAASIAALFVGMVCLHISRKMVATVSDPGIASLEEPIAPLVLSGMARAMTFRGPNRAIMMMAESAAMMDLGKSMADVSGPPIRIRERLVVVEPEQDRTSPSRLSVSLIPSLLGF